MPRKKKILYVPAPHPILEYDDLRIFTNAGYQVFSFGAFCDPQNPRTLFRQARAEFFSPDDFDIARDAGCLTAPRRLTREFVNRFDLILVNHAPDIIRDNADIIFSRPVIYRAIGQGTIALEDILKPFADRLRIVRYSEHDSHSDLLRTDAVIRFGKYTDEFPKWRGGSALRTFRNSTATRPYCTPNLNDYQKIVMNERAELYGHRNDGIPNARGIVAPDEQMAIYQTCKAYIYVHSDGAPYTLNLMEAMLTGAPILAPSEALIAQNAPPGWWPGRYEVENLLSNGAGLLYASVAEAKDILAHLDDYDLDAISATCRARARELFDARVIERQWCQVIGRLC